MEADGSGFAVHTSTGDTLTAPSVIAASGSFSNPRLPALTGFNGEVRHAARYANPAPYSGKHVIVVGAGNSAVQIAYELAEVASVTLATREPVRSRFDGEKVVWDDGSTDRVDAIILATGYRPSLGYLSGLDALDTTGRPKHVAGVSTTHPGLGYLGLEWQRSPASNALRGVGRDARHLVRKLAAHRLATTSSVRYPRRSIEIPATAPTAVITGPHDCVPAPHCADHGDK